MILIGAHRILPASPQGEDAVAAFYAELIPRLKTRIQPAVTSRLVGFRAQTAPEHFWQFLGLEANEAPNVTSGLAALRLGETSGELSQARFDLSWVWRDCSRPFAVGEFNAIMPGTTSRAHCFWMTANSCLPAAGTAAAEDAIELVEYDAAWPGQFDEMARRLRALAPGVAARVVHYGSTAIRGMPAKPVIDMLVEAPSFDVARRALIPALNSADWEYWWYADHMIFIKRDRTHGLRTHHVHIAPPGHRLWEGVVFRDYLIAHPDAARDYAALKHDLAARFRTEREKYTDAKGAFIRAITDKAQTG